MYIRKFQKIIHIELSSDMGKLCPDPGYTSAYVIFWWFGICLGHREIVMAQLPKNPAATRLLAVQTIAPTVAAYLSEQIAPLPDLDGLTAADADSLLRRWEPLFKNWVDHRRQPSQATLSVVICTRDRPHFIETCLQSLQSLIQPPEEIIVVDNAPSSDATRQIVARMPGIKYVLEPRPGLDFARNAGLAHSTGEILAYTDDDVNVCPDWALHLRRAFEDPTIMAMTGLVLAADLDTESQYIFEKYWSFNRGYVPRLYGQEFFQKYRYVGVPAWYVGAGANMAFRRSCFESTGRFDERLDVGAAGCSGDSEMWYRVLAEGFTIRYEPLAVVAHTHRQEMSALHKQLFYYMRGHVSELLIRFERYRHLGNLVRLALLPVYFSSLLLLGWRSGWHRYKTVLTEMSGCLSGFKFYFGTAR